VITSFDTPVGPLGLSVSKHGLATSHFLKLGSSLNRPQKVKPRENSSLILEQATKQLEAYFKKERALFTLKLDPQGTTFQQKVWCELLTIPYGCTTTYGELAKRLGVKSAQAVGQAVKHNPLPIIIPCHRVLPATGSIQEPGGYAGGIARKRWLLNHENTPRSIDALPSSGVRYSGAVDGPHIELNQTVRSS